MISKQELLNAKLRKAASHGTTDDIYKALAEGADINSRDPSLNSGMTALHLAVLYNKPDNFRALVRPDLQLDVKDAKGFTALHLAAAMENNAPIVQALVDNGANLEAKDNLGQTPLHRAAEKTRTDSARILIEAGADIYVTDKYGRTPRMLASIAHPTDTFEFLKAEEAKRSEPSWADKAKKGEPPARQ